MSPLPFSPRQKDAVTLAPDKDLLRQLFALNQKLGNLDLELMKIKAHMESLKDDIRDLTEMIRKK
jgi:cell division protein FtsB